MRVQCLAVLALAILASPCAAGAHAAPDAVRPAPFDDQFAVKWNGIPMGEMRVTLEPLAGEPGCYVQRALTRTNLVARLLYGTPSQISTFCVVDGKIRPQEYRFVRGGHSDANYTLHFDWRAGTVTDQAGRVRPLPADAVDSLSIQQAVRLWLMAGAQGTRASDVAFTLVDDAHFTRYRFRRMRRATIDTPAGRFATWLVERVDNPDKIGKYWIAPAHHYLPVASETRNGRGLVLDTMLVR